MINGLADCSDGLDLGERIAQGDVEYDTNSDYPDDEYEDMLATGGIGGKVRFDICNTMSFGQGFKPGM